MKGLRRFLVANLVLVVALALAGVAQAQNKGPAQIVIKQVPNKVQKPVSFPHAKHQAANIACVKCHHTTRGAEAAKPCAGCHLKPAQAGQPDLKAAFHGKGCIGCHKAENAAHAGVPTKCGECHK